MNPQFVFFVLHSFQVLLVKFLYPFSSGTAAVVVWGLYFCGAITEPFSGFPPHSVRSPPAHVPPLQTVLQ